MNLRKYIAKSFTVISSQARKVTKLWKCNKEIVTSSIDDIDSLDKFEIKAASGHPSPKIYANGKNQVAIEIIVKASNKNNTVVQLSEKEWLEGLSLCFAGSDKKLNKNGDKNWCFTNKQNEYCREISSVFLGENKRVNFVDDDGTAIITLYVYTDVVEQTRIAVCFDTKQKHFTTSDCNKNAEKMSVLIDAIKPINYSDRTNTEIKIGDFVDINTNLGWTSRLSTEGPYTEHHNGICRRRIVEIYPNQVFTGQTDFKRHNINYPDRVKDSDVSQGSVTWGAGSENGFEAINSDSHLPFAVIGRGGSADNWQTNFWFPRKSKVHIDGHYFLAGVSFIDYYYRFAAYVGEDHSNDDEQGKPSLLLYKFIMPEATKPEFDYFPSLTKVSSHFYR